MAHQMYLLLQIVDSWWPLSAISSSTKVRVMTSYESIAIAKPKHCKGIIDRARSQSRSAEAARAVLEWWSAHTTHSKTRYIQDFPRSMIMTTDSGHRVILYHCVSFNLYHGGHASLPFLILINSINQWTFKATSCLFSQWDNVRWGCSFAPFPPSFRVDVWCPAPCLCCPLTITTSVPASVAAHTGPVTAQVCPSLLSPRPCSLATTHNTTLLK